MPCDEGFDVFIEVRAAESGGNVERKALDESAHGIAVASGVENGLLHGFAARVVDDGQGLAGRGPQSLGIGSGEIEGGVIDARNAFDAREHFHAPGAQGQLGHGSGKDQRSREAAGKVTAAAVVLKTAVAQMSGEVRVAGTGEPAGGGVVAERVSVFSITPQRGVPQALPSNTPLRMRTSSFSFLAVASGDLPGARRAISARMKSSSMSSPEGTP